MTPHTLPARVLQIISADRWGGGVHRDQLAWLVGHQPRDRELTACLMMLYRKRRIDFCGQYVVPGLDR